MLGQEHQLPLFPSHRTISPRTHARTPGTPACPVHPPARPTARPHACMHALLCAPPYLPPPARQSLLRCRTTGRHWALLAARRRTPPLPPPCPAAASRTPPVRRRPAAIHGAPLPGRGPAAQPPWRPPHVAGEWWRRAAGALLPQRAPALRSQRAGGESRVWWELATPTNR